MGMIIWVQLLGVHTPEILGSKKRQNLARFWTTLDFDP